MPLLSFVFNHNYINILKIFIKVCTVQGRSVGPPKQPEVPACDHGEGGDGGGDGEEEEGRQEPGLQADGCQAGRDSSTSETSAR